MSPDEIVYKTPAPKPFPQGVYTCPFCTGGGRAPDGMMSVGYGADGSVTIKSRPGALCGLCLGSGKVKIEPYSE